MAIPKGDGYGSLGSCGEHTTVATNTDSTVDPPSRAMYFSAAGTFQSPPLWTATSATITVVAGGWLPLRVRTVHAAPAATMAHLLATMASQRGTLAPLRAQVARIL